jgi:hypothetical protein
MGIELGNMLGWDGEQPPLTCIICIILLSLARSISSFFFLSEGGFASETSIAEPPISFPFSSLIAYGRCIKQILIFTDLYTKNVINPAWGIRGVTKIQSDWKFSLCSRPQ